MNKALGEEIEFIIGKFYLVNGSFRGNKLQYIMEVGNMTSTKVKNLREPGFDEGVLEDPVDHWEYTGPFQSVEDVINNCPEYFL
jgi:hypothetical protein